MAKDELTPMMRQFHDMKAANPDAILLFRCGDFYETYCGDAVTASQVLGITLTKRNQKGGERLDGNGRFSSPCARQLPAAPDPGRISSGHL